MNSNTFKLSRLAIIALVAITVSTTVSINNFFLAIGGILIGMLFLFLVRRKTNQVMIDERIEIISGRAARSTYTITTMLLVVLSMFFIIQGGIRGDLYSESLGVALAFITLLNVALYSISFYYYNHRYGGTRK
jgi:LPXTG-motif cell wall-anchored protein